jgi:hypothetical protein
LIVQSIEASFAEEQRRIDYGASDKASSPLPPDTDPEPIFYRKWGYLPPLDEEAVAVIEAIIMTGSSNAKDYRRIGPHSKEFTWGLRYRNVFLKESPDAYVDHIQRLVAPESVPESEGETESHGRIWTMDRAKCDEGFSEALFQRTVMMSLIARHRLIYPCDASNQQRLDFSVEEIWNCPPMPTRAYEKGAKFLTRPKPDLAVFFRREALISDRLWNNMPKATKSLACYENDKEVGETRVFHFFTIEAKKQGFSSKDTVGKRQSLNNASQALHNMFEFFRDAGHEKTYFTKVRFFSVVASTEGLTIYIHRATQEPADGSDQGFIIEGRPEYPLRFEFREFANFLSDNFERGKVLETLEKILLAYGANELFALLQDAAKAIMEKLSKDPAGMKHRENDEFYRHGQTHLPSSTN